MPNASRPGRTALPHHRAGLWLLLPLPLTPLAAHAQSASFRSVDTDGDGVLSRGELVAAFGAAGAAQLLDRSDHNRVGILTISELRRDRRDDDNRPDDDDRTDDDDDGDDDDDDGDDDNDGDDGGGGDDGGDDGGGDDD